MNHNPQQSPSPPQSPTLLPIPTRRPCNNPHHHHRPRLCNPPRRRPRNSRPCRPLRNKTTTRTANLPWPAQSQRNTDTNTDSAREIDFELPLVLGLAHGEFGGTCGVVESIGRGGVVVCI